MVCCLMIYLLKVLSDMLQSPQPFSQIQIFPKPEVKLAPTDLIHPAPPSSLDIAIARNPNQIGLTDRDLKLSISLHNVSVPPKRAIGPTDFSYTSLILLIAKFGLTEFMRSVSLR